MEVKIGTAPPHPVNTRIGIMSRVTVNTSMSNHSLTVAACARYPSFSSSSNSSSKINDSGCNNKNNHSSANRKESSALTDPRNIVLDELQSIIDGHGFQLIGNRDYTRLPKGPLCPPFM